MSTHRWAVVVAWVTAGPHGVQGVEGLCGGNFQLKGPWPPPRATCLSTAAIMFAANLTLGLYVHFGPKPLTPNSTIGLQSVALGGTEVPLATPTNYVTLVPLLATMLFIMGRFGWRETLGLPPEGWLHGGASWPAREVLSGG